MNCRLALSKQTVRLPGSTSGLFIEAGNELTTHKIAAKKNMTTTGLEQKKKTTGVTWLGEAFDAETTHGAKV